MLRYMLAVVVAATACAHVVVAQQNRIDVVTPSAPELASYGQYDIGVRTLQATATNRPDVLNTKPGEPTVRYDRTLTIEVWYPATLTAEQNAGGEYRVITRDPSVMATLYGKAVRNAAPAITDRAFPLVIISHGYPGNRYLLSHLAENLASKGLVIASIDHKDSTYDDQKSFASTLYNRSLDQLFVLNEMARLSESSGNGLAGLIDANRTGIVGYSMGGYGVVNTVGGGYSKASETHASAPPNKLLADRGAANLDYVKSIDRRIKAAIAIAPWGMQAAFWDAEGLTGIKTPIMFVAGSQDDISGYNNGTRAIYQAAVNADRYLLTYVNANHNAGAPIPAPAEAYAFSETLKSFPFMHYADAVWDTTRMNNILAHFATAYFDLHLKGERGKKAYLDLVPHAADGVYSVDKDGKPTANHTYWKGFKPRTAVGLILEHAAAAK